MVACLLTFKDQGQIDIAFGRIRYTLQLQNRIHELVLAVHEVDAAQRGYLYTGRTQYLEAYESSEAKIPSSLAALRQAIVDDPTQEQSMIELEALVLDRVGLARQIVKLKKSGLHEAAVKLVRADRSNTAVETIDTIAKQMRNQEEILLASRDRALAGRRQAHARWLYALLVLNVSSLACTLFLLHRLGKAQSLARVCAWSKRIEHNGQWLSFEEYLSRRFNIDTTHTISPSEIDRLMCDIAPELAQLPAPQSESKPTVGVGG